jgi:hypothetical protein
MGHDPKDCKMTKSDFEIYLVDNFIVQLLKTILKSLNKK